MSYANEETERNAGNGSQSGSLEGKTETLWQRLRKRARSFARPALAVPLMLTLLGDGGNITQMVDTKKMIFDESRRGEYSQTVQEWRDELANYKVPTHPRQMSSLSAKLRSDNYEVVEDLGPYWLHVERIATFSSSGSGGYLRNNTELIDKETGAIVAATSQGSGGAVRIPLQDEGLVVELSLPYRQT